MITGTFIRRMLLAAALASSAVPGVAQNATVGPSQPLILYSGENDAYILQQVLSSIPNARVCSYEAQLVGGSVEISVGLDSTKPANWELIDECEETLEWLNFLLVNGSSAPERDRAQATTVSTAAGAALGSQGLISFALPNGTLMAASISDGTLSTAPVPSGAASQQLQPAAQYTLSGQNPQHVIVGDFNGDGNPDLAISDFGNLDTNEGGDIQILLGSATGAFAGGSTVNAGITPVAMATADFNGDGKPDLAAANLTNSTISVMLSNGDGTFQAPSSYAVSEFPESLIAADFNGDGKPDIAVVSQGGQVAVLMGNGNGTFQSAVNYSAGANSASYLASMDLNGDGKQDLIVADDAANALAFLLGNGDGTFQEPVLYLTGADPYYFGLVEGTAGERIRIVTADAASGNQQIIPVLGNGSAVSPQLYSVPAPASGIAAADLNGDGYPDMVTANGGVSVLLRNPKAQFNAPLNYTLPSGSQAVSVALGDLRGNGKTDVVVSSVSPGNAGGAIDVLLGNGNGTLGTQTSYPLGGDPGAFTSSTPAGGIVLGDFNGDGKPDVAAGFATSSTGSGAGGISVLLGNGDGTLQPAVNYAAGGLSITGLVAADFNGDGKLDLAAAAGAANFNLSTPGSVALFLGNGNGTFQPATLVQAGSPAGTPVALAAADVNGDGKPDLVVSVLSPQGSDSIVMLLGNGNGTFRQLSPLQTPVQGYPIALLDLNGDGIPDLVVGDSLEAVYLLGNGDGTFQSPQYFNSGSEIQAFATADWNKNGIAGLAVASRPGLVMAMESGLNPALTAGGAGTTPNKFTSLVSAAGGESALAPGSLAIASGTDLATAEGAPGLPWPLSFEGTSISVRDSAGASTQAQISYVSPGEVIFRIPSGAATGTATITVTSGDGTESTGQVTLASLAPALFPLDSSNLAAGYAVCTSSTGAQTEEEIFQTMNGAIQPLPLNLSACSKTVLNLYATGLDSASASQVQVKIGTVTAAAQSTGPEGSLPGIDVVAVTIPSSLKGTGNVPVVVTAGGHTSNTVNLSIR